MLDLATPDEAGQKDRQAKDEPFEILILGAGVAGIAAARDIQKLAPDARFAILEGREASGGTWDLFRYPGVRSDSDLQTLAFSDRPVFNGAWTGEGADVLAYIREAARESGVDKKILFEHRVLAANFDTKAGLWLVDVAIGAEKRLGQFTCRFLYACCGYYDYAAGYTPDFPGNAEYSGRILHPQFWPSDFDASGKRIIVIGSGATAISLIPALAAKAAHVVMLQRSPSYIMPLPGKDYDGRVYQRILPGKLAYALIRWRNILITLSLFHLARSKPGWSKQQLMNVARKRLGLDDKAMANFTPRYDVWDQRLCFDPGFAFYNCLRDGSASIVTAPIDCFVAEGLRLDNGEILRADAIVTATGLQFLAFGGVRLSVDGKEIEPGELMIYKGCMFAGLPNLVAAIGYINASWTLKCQLTTLYLLRLRREMAARQAKWAAPQNAPAPIGPMLALTSGYIERTKKGIPKQGATPPWRYNVNYFRDFWSLRFGRVADDFMHFDRNEAESRFASIARFAVKTCLKPALHPRLPIAMQRRWASVVMRTLYVPFGVHFSQTSLAGVPTEKVSSRSEAVEPKSAVLFLHGGAFMICSPASHRSITGRLAKAVGATVFVPDYRLAPEHPYPAALDDAVASYRALLEQGYAPEQIAVAGDSAGGGLALSLCLRLRGEGSPLPACLALISPWADLTLTQVAKIADDPLLCVAWGEQGAAAYLQGRSADDPLVSPLFADLPGMPPTLIQSASEEMLREDSRRLAKALTEAGVRVKSREFPRMWHDFQLYAGIVPEATQAVDEIACFIRSAFAP